MYDAICLASGGLDSTVCLHLLRDQSIQALPAYVNYGQRGHSREWKALATFCRQNNFPRPINFDVSSFGKIVRSGLTDKRLRVLEDAFTPGRNLLFLVLAGALASSRGVKNIVIGLLAERTTIFPDQSDRFLRKTEDALSEAMGATLQIHCPLRDFTKTDVVKLAKSMNISNSYSCHAGGLEPCGKCIACLEYT